MLAQTESIAIALGALRTELMEQGYTQDQAFAIVQDLIHRGDPSTGVAQPAGR